MRVLMLGWEFPPFISGGLGTACYGLTRALSKRQTEVTFVLPKAVHADYSAHVKLLSPQSPAAAEGSTAPDAVASHYRINEPAATAAGATGSSPGVLDADPPQPAPAPAAGTEGDFAHVSFRAVPSQLSSPYPTGAAGGGAAHRGETIGFLNAATSGGQGGGAQPQAGGEASSVPGPGSGGGGASGGGGTSGGGYGSDIHRDALRYAGLCVALARGERFDVVHAHDWFTFPAGQAVAATTGKPLVVHVHSTEFDRSGEHIDPRVYHLERDGCHAAARVIAVSRRTRDVLVQRYGVPEDKIEVVYNGVENGHVNPDLKLPRVIEKTDKVVLFLGRVTMQKGPEYFIEAARKVLDKMDGVKFVVAGTGDKIYEMIEHAARAGIGSKIVFTGFLRGRDVERVYQMADVFVMPSVSEPFGIAPLEAISHDVPVIVSKQSGVSEVIAHALKVDFWDTDEMANKIIAVLRHPPLGATLREHAEVELRRLTWDGAAEKCAAVYDAVTA